NHSLFFINFVQHFSITFSFSTFSIISALSLITFLLSFFTLFSFTFFFAFFHSFLHFFHQFILFFDDIRKLHISLTLSGFRYSLPHSHTLHLHLHLFLYITQKISQFISRSNGILLMRNTFRNIRFG